MSLVLDSSATLAWVFADEIADPIRRVFDLVCENGAWVPGLWKPEVANILETGVRRGRHTGDFRDATLADLAQLPIRVDAETDLQAWGGVASAGGAPSPYPVRCGVSGARASTRFEVGITG